ncbi:MAG: hypothetical protein H0T42_17390 [Deltaproteobacteria bacterium]|nr:hypothetical protein [Deltaproteobacteria bacterium]
MGILKALTGWFRKGPARPSEAEQRLVYRCAGDVEQAERLINLELSRRPQISRATACDAAMDRWNRDR